MRQVSRRGALVLGVQGLGALLLAACQRQPIAPIYPELSFRDQPPQRLRLASIEVIDRYVPLLKLPNVEHTFPTTPARALGIWARDRLLATGGREAARFVIDQASVVETRLPRRSGLEGLVTVDAGWRWDATLAVRLEVGQAGRQVQASARRTVTIPENIRAEDRDDTAFQMVQDVMAAFDGAMITAIRQNLTDYLG